MLNKFKIGDVVFFKSDSSIKMVITATYSDGGVYCTYFNSQNLKFEGVTLPQEALELFE